LPDADELLALPRQRLDHAAAGLGRALRANAQLHRVALSRIGGRLGPHLLRGTVERRRERYGGLASRLRASFGANVEAYRTRNARQRDRITGLAERAERAVGVMLDRCAARYERAGQLLAAFSYRGVLARGFALVRDAESRPLRAAAAVSTGMRLDIEFADGRVGAVAGDAQVTPVSAPAPLFRRRRRRSSGEDEGQGSLF
jgi:exodeoxyribonuclease VII large subunit